MTGFDAQRARAALEIPAAIYQLDNLTEPTARAVLDLHIREPWGRTQHASRWMCEACMAEDYADWPCRTVLAVAFVHRIDLDDAWLYQRPADGSLDLCPDCTWTEQRHLCEVLPTLHRTACEAHR